MNYRKNTRLPQTRVKSVQPLASGGTFISCYAKNGKLYGGITAQKITHSGVLPKNVSVAFYAADTNSVYTYNGGIFYASLENNKFVDLSITFSQPVCFADYLSDEEPAVIFGYGIAFTELRGGVRSVAIMPQKVKNALFHCGRFFFIGMDDPFTVYWTGLGGASDWTEGAEGCGSLSLEDRDKGAVLRIVHCGDRLVLVRQYGLTLMAALGTPENFRVGTAAFGTGAVYENSVASDGATLFFATPQGLFSFNGSALAVLSEEPVVQSPVSACATENKYFVAAYCPAISKNAVYCADRSLGVGYYIDLPATALCAGGSVYAFANSGFYRLSRPNVPACDWRSLPVDFGTARGKALRSFSVSRGEGTVEVTDGRRTRTFSVAADSPAVPAVSAVSASPAAPAVRAEMRGGQFTVRLVGNFEGAEVTLSAEVIQ